MIRFDWSRKHINKQTSRVVRIFRWAAAQEYVPGRVVEDLSKVSGLTKGRTAARETTPIRPVADEIVEATLPFLPRIVADMVRLQRLSGVRPEEVCGIRPVDVDCSGPVWIYRPEVHKMEHEETVRVIPLGPKAQEILCRYLLDRSNHEFCFSPREAELERRKRQHSLRITPLEHGNRPGTNRKVIPKRSAGRQYTTDSYRRAIQRACELAFGMPEQLRSIDKSLAATEKDRLRGLATKWRREHCWAPNRLRHSAATQIRKHFGIEAAQTVLGHARADTTQIYAERNLQLAVQVARELG